MGKLIEHYCTWSGERQYCSDKLSPSASPASRRAMARLYIAPPAPPASLIDPVDQ
ncbi:hypothetical protein MC7420_2339 [Coleofasciculus chthonoplastes PCC 7420]|uniref:Uncharacterized protein n=1 Tax=Coleofasciculus chthonoplastes PCC 7420 TaxID=118168 RepID=B4W277_9CYAN|nr:hypothetical protein [Coleofasciculus chthonoplastes]EDX71673.1 hypothetical protein MC7420_2339 [Coleofasciculus chthonoplastes PCC 7420]